VQGATAREREGQKARAREREREREREVKTYALTPVSYVDVYIHTPPSTLQCATVCRSIAVCCKVWGGYDQ